MDTISYSDAHQILDELMDRVCEEHKPVIVTRKLGSPVVMMSLADYKALLANMDDATESRESHSETE